MWGIDDLEAHIGRLAGRRGGGRPFTLVPAAPRTSAREAAANRIGMLLAITLGLSSAGMLPAAHAQGNRVPASLAARTRSFLTAVNGEDYERLLEFFPTRGRFTYVHTLHSRAGDRRGVSHFLAAQKRDAIEKGALFPSFALQVENQPVGLFAHQVMMRGARWHRVSGTRFVPPGETASSDIFVEWRREGSKWVVSSFGDEGFSDLPLPPWMEPRGEKSPR